MELEGKVDNKDHRVTVDPSRETDKSDGYKYDIRDHQDVHIKGKDDPCWRKTCQYLRHNYFMVLIFVGICVGFGLGLGVREFNPSDNVVLWIGMPGDLYMRLLKMTIMPLIVCSVVAGASNLDPKTNGKIGGVIIALVVITQIIGCCLSTGLVLIIKPGAKGKTAPTRKLEKAMMTHDIFADLLRNLMPDNVIGATFRQSVTKYVLDNDDHDSGDTTNANNASLLQYNASKDSNGSRIDISREGIDINTAVKQYTRVVTHSDGINVLGLITISGVFGIAAGKVRKDVPVFLTFIENTLQLVFIVVRCFFWLTPIGVVSLIAKSMSQVDDVVETFSDLGMFVVTVVSALIIHWMVVLPAFYVITVRKNPLNFFLSQFPAVSIAFASTASTIAVPEMLLICENKFHMDKRVTRIGMPIAITMNSDGSSIFIMAASLFISDYTGVDNTANSVLVTLVLAIVSGLAIPGVPSASIFTVIIILTAVNVPLQNVAILFAVEWLLDRIRTGLNTASHMTVVACANALCKNILRKMDDAAVNGDDFDGGDDDDDDVKMNGKELQDVNIYL